MKIIEGFVTIAPYVNNTPNAIAALGELSTWARTYSKEKGEYQVTQFPLMKLITFKNVDTDTHLPFVIGDPIVLQTMNLVTAVMTYASGHVRPYDAEDFYTSIQVGFTGVLNNINFGAFVDNGNIALPEWLSWESATQVGVSVKIWLSDTAFTYQFTGTEITTIPPLDVLDHFFNGYNAVTAELATHSMVQLGSRINSAKGQNPETYIRFLTFDYINVNNPEQRQPTVWPVLIYGRAGDNIDSQKDAIVEYVLSNSTRTRSQWEAIIPELFKRTEFVILPRWDLLSIPNATVLSSLYSSMINPLEAVSFAQQSIEFYSDPFISNNVTVLPSVYKTLSLIVVNGNNNSAGATAFKPLFSDYLPVPTTSPDFNRMTIATREWSLLLEEALITAETADQYTSLPMESRLIQRNGTFFLSFLYNNINYLVATRKNAIYEL